MTRTLQRFTNFNRVRKSWLGAGGEPVSIELAQQRANICAACPMNYAGSWVWNMATRWTIAAWSKLRETMNLHVDGEDKLGTCEACGCVIKLKIFVPLKHISKHTSPQQLNKYHHSCWIRNEKPQ